MSLKTLAVNKGERSTICATKESMLYDAIRRWRLALTHTHAPQRKCAGRHPADTASPSSQNQRSPRAALIRVRSYQGDHGAW